MLADMKDKSRAKGGRNLFPEHFDDRQKTFAPKGVRAVVVSTPV